MIAMLVGVALALLGPPEAVSGTLGFGWSTAAVATVAIPLIRYRHRTDVFATLR
jgi:hypothetical protein